MISLFNLMYYYLQAACEEEDWLNLWRYCGSESEHGHLGGGEMREL